MRGAGHTKAEYYHVHAYDDVLSVWKSYGQRVGLVVPCCMAFVRELDGRVHSDVREELADASQHHYHADGEVHYTTARELVLAVILRQAALERERRESRGLLTRCRRSPWWARRWKSGREVCQRLDLYEKCVMRLLWFLYVVLSNGREFTVAATSSDLDEARTDLKNPVAWTFWSCWSDSLIHLVIGHTINLAE